MASYTKTALALKTLEGVMGRERFARAMRTYFERYAWSHPTGDDLFAVLSEVAGEDLDWFFDQAFRGDAAVDWSVLSVRHRRQDPIEGVRWDGAEWAEAVPAEDAADGPDWDVTVELGRRGDFVGPVEAEIRFEDGTTERRVWQGTDRWVRWTMPSASRVERVIVDPDGVWALETRRRDNYWASESSSRVACRSLWWVSEVFHLLGLIHMPWS
jgi:hypothetical protein